MKQNNNIVLLGIAFILVIFFLQHMNPQGYAAKGGTGGGSGGLTKPACSDGIDNDCDQYTDFQSDRGCEGDNKKTSEKSAKYPCDDGIDNDGDGKIDFVSWKCPEKNGDPGCNSPVDSDERGDPVQCNDGIDNDKDGKIDYLSDSGCTSISDNTELEECKDGIDNDGDGLIDYPADLQCADTYDNWEGGPTRYCADGIDNDDLDTLVDMNDPNCQTSTIRNPWEDDGSCDSKTDEDGDGYPGYPTDPECSSYSDPTEWECTDSDGGGFDFATRGTTTGSQGGISFTYTDYCVVCPDISNVGDCRRSNPPESTTGNVVVEQSCGYGPIKSLYPCNCESGVCKP